LHHTPKGIVPVPRNFIIIVKFIVNLCYSLWSAIRIIANGGAIILIALQRPGAIILIALQRL
jgi:hypothetical protein